VITFLKGVHAGNVQYKPERHAKSKDDMRKTRLAYVKWVADESSTTDNYVINQKTSDYDTNFGNPFANPKDFAKLALEAQKEVEEFNAEIDRVWNVVLEYQMISSKA
jgi:hypothetical protein